VGAGHYEFYLLRVITSSPELHLSQVSFEAREEVEELSAYLVEPN